MRAVILWIEGRQAEGLPFIASLRKKGYQVDVVSTGSEALSRLAMSVPSLTSPNQAAPGMATPDLVVINAASLRSSGTRICSTLRKQAGKLPILAIVENSQAVPKIECADVILSLPFTARKLLNRIVPLLPWSGDQTLQAGPIRLDLEKRRVDCDGRVTRLTPSLTALLKMLMERRGEVLAREDLFRQVWETNYIGDTRTLDVHISWLRQAIEKDPHHPALLKTMRGVGYRLDV
jgi:DNA-binding response OmpR family regulator